MDIYRERILEHYKYPRNFGHLKNPDARSEEHNVSCGDRIAIEIHLAKDAKGLKDIRFSGEGCAISIAAASLLTEQAKEMKIHSILHKTPDEILQLLEITLTPTRLKCALLPLEVLQKTIRAGLQKKGYEDVV